MIKFYKMPLRGVLILYHLVPAIGRMKCQTTPAVTAVSTILTTPTTVGSSTSQTVTVVKNKKKYKGGARC